MSELIDRAIAHITEQMMEHEDDYMYITLEECLTNNCNTDAIAEKLLTEGKTLEAFISSLWELARKRQSGSCAVLSGDEVIPMLEKYYGITEDDKNTVPVIDISQFL